MRKPSITDPPKPVLLTGGLVDVELDPPLVGLSFSAAGTVHVTDMDGDEVTIPSGVLAAGVQHVMGIIVFHSDSTAANPVGYRSRVR